VSEVLSRLRRFGAEIGYAVLPALVAAALHLTIVFVRRRLIPATNWDWNTRDVGWMVPAGYILIFALCAVPLALLAALRRNGLPSRARVWFWSSLTLFAVLLLFTRVSSWAWVVVALGAGLQVSAWARGHPVGWKRATRAVGFALGILFACVALIGGLLRVVQERRLLAALPPTSDKPNVLLVIWDTARAQDMSLYGYQRHTTPFLDSLARHAVVFDYAFSAAPWTLPSHASMLTGQYAAALTADWTSPLDRTYPTLAEALYKDGYSTSAFIANFFAASYPTGLHRGFIRYEALKFTLEEILLNTTLTQARAVQTPLRRITEQRWYSQAVKDFLRFDWRPLDSYQVHDAKDVYDVHGEFLRWQAKTRRPFFAMLNLMEAHAGYANPSDTIFAGGKTRKDEYDGSILRLDQNLKSLFAELDRRGDLARTIVIVTSDHGELFGEHGQHGHGASLYSAVLEVPLLIYAPGRLPEGVRVNRTVSLRDIARTIQLLTGSTGTPLPGASLAALATDANALTSPVVAAVSKGVNQQMDTPISWGKLTSVTDDTLHAIRDNRGRMEAYAYRSDVAESNDLARDPMRRAQIEKWFAQHLHVAGLQSEMNDHNRP
jgi:arylsulfatase A-like enzyme